MNIIIVIYLRLFPLPLSFVRLKKCWNFAHGSMFKIKLPLVYLFFQELIFFQS